MFFIKNFLLSFNAILFAQHRTLTFVKYIINFIFLLIEELLLAVINSCSYTTLKLILNQVF